MVQNKGLIFSKVPTELPVAGEHLLIQDRPFDLDQAPPEGGVTTKNYYASFDPYQRGRMRDAAVKSYAPAFTLRQPITNASIVKVIKSANASFKPGEVLITGSETPTEEYSSLGPAQLSGARKLENPHHLDPYLWLGALGMPGLTAFSSLYEIGKPKKGETIFISSAAGAVGQIVGQLAKEEGLKVIGSAGDDKKVDFLSRELQFNGVFNYKKEKPADALKRLAPDGIDIYFENVGGEHLEAALDALNKHGRIVACGMISMYNQKPEDMYPIRNLMRIVANRLTIEGFIVGDERFGPKYQKEHQQKLQQWLADGSFKAKTDVIEGIDKAADGLIGLFQGHNFGKLVLQIAKLDT